MEKYIVLQGFYDCYAVSDLGNIKNLRSGHVLQPSIRPDGYKSVLLSRNGKKMSIRVHRLVAQYFLPKDDSRTDVNHKNGVKHDNRLENLEWCTKSENMQHAYDTGLIKESATNMRTVLVYDFLTGRFLFSFESVKQCAKSLGLNSSPIYRVLKEERNHHHNYKFKYKDRIQ